MRALLPFLLLASVGVAEESMRVLPGRMYAVGADEGTVMAWVVKHGLKPAGPIATTHDGPWKAGVPVTGKEVPPSGGCRLQAEPPRLVLRGESFAKLVPAVKKRGLRYVTRRTVGTEAQIVVEHMRKCDVAVYAGPGTWPVGLLAVSDALDAAGLRFRPVTAAMIRGGNLGKIADCLLVPGGWAAAYRESLGIDGARKIREFVRGGGGYAGVCAGAFYAAPKIKWEGETVPYDLDLFPGVPEGALQEIAPWPTYALTELALRDHAITRGLGKRRTTLYLGGPKLVVNPGANVNVLATYGKDGDPAMVAFKSKKGRVFLTGVHPEIQLGPSTKTIGWPIEEVAKPDKDADAELLARGVRWVLGK